MFEIVKEGFAKLGVKVTQKVGGDTTATYALRDGRRSARPAKQAIHRSFDIAMWDWVGYIEPGLHAVRRHEGPVVLVERHGQGQSCLRQVVRKAGHDDRPGGTQAIVYAMQKIVYDNFYYTQLTNQLAIDAHVK